MDQLRSLIHSKDVTAQPAISIVGLHRRLEHPARARLRRPQDGQSRPRGCSTEVPSFWVADDKGDTKGLKVRVIGWARNFARH